MGLTWVTDAKVLTICFCDLCHKTKMSKFSMKAHAALQLTPVFTYRMVARGSSDLAALRGCHTFNVCLYVYLLIFWVAWTFHAPVLGRQAFEAILCLVPTVVLMVST
jgi:protein gp37